MKLIIKSNKIFQNTHENEDNVHFITQFFIPNDITRNNEIKFCLKKNVENNKIDKIHLLVEKLYSESELGISSEKINQVFINKRLTYADVFSYAKDLKGYIIFANADIFFQSHSISVVKKSNMSTEKIFCALLRYDYVNSSSHRIFGPRFDSQDSWIFHSNYNIPNFAIHLFSFFLGTPGCDNKIVYLMAILGYEILNDPISIPSFHVHSSKQRNYSHKDIIPEPWGMIIPFGFEPSSIVNSLGIQLKQFSVWSKNFTTLMYDDNDYLRNYIFAKLEKNQHFVIPRISGIENNVAVFAKAVDEKLVPSIGQLENYIANILGAMKNNAGIFLDNKQSIKNYSREYLSVFSMCDIFAGWDPQGNYIGHVAQSHAYIQNVYSSKSMIWALTFDIFHYIFSHPWTHALRGKRILIISPFVDSIESQLRIREYIYGIDLFPECEFVLLKPPQTQADEPAKDFVIEFDNFKKKVDNILNDFDVALVSCGGYANPICAHIYMKGKSAIYVGGVLQMYFGILGNRWLKERPEIVKLYRNQHWTRPKTHERPKNSGKVENGCYW